ncbi:response regulator transcription factor [Thalassotalea sp. 1_MG-2023]|uniref:response regulator transcription factor n=1 Tax=Thalassotalea sp. 1_MG-2023 TaxID=3062680 RepID=UPI0026E12B89|nr:response regulator transcription factor [Thalassotalea sp. 1_MG-2023]MDO6427772.1 response regulator transcription factor [Thalassotalea sp. 1_MG-2023]
MNRVKILIIEDDIELNHQLTELIQANGFFVEQCFDGESGLVKASSQQYQLILLDIMLPVLDGLTLLKMLRKTTQVPVIMVTAKGAEQERIEGFSQGADDYVAKPFNTRELILRIEALLRRSVSNTPTEDIKTLSEDNLALDARTLSVSIYEQTLDFTPIEFKLLWELFLHKGQVLSKAYLYQQVLNRSIGEYDRSLDMHLSRVRKKLNTVNGTGGRLKTSHGKGYSFV